MKVSNSQLKRILDSASVEFGGIHDRNGWRYMAVYRIDFIKITLDVKSKNPKKVTLDKLLLIELEKRIANISVSLDVSCSGYISEPYISDPYGVMPLIKKYLVHQYLDFPHKKAV
jgi:hypothetical protein